MLKTHTRRTRAPLPDRPVALPGAAPAMLASAAPPTDERMLLNYANIEEALIAAHGLGDLGPGVVAPRLTYLQKLGFPAGTRPGRGTKSRYGIEDVLKIALAFELLQIGLQPTRVVRLVTTDWLTSAGAIAAAVRDVAGGDGAKPHLIAIKADAIAEPAEKNGGLGKPLPDLVGLFSPAALAEHLTSPEVHDRRFILLDAGRMMAALAPALGALAVTDRAEVDRELELFAASAIG